MKKLFLASIACVVLDKVKPLLPEDQTKRTVAFVPTASNPNEDKSWLQKEKDALTELGMKIIDLDIERKSADEIKVILDNADVLFVAGGNTFYLLDQARKSGFDKLATEYINQGKLYIGSSAGAMLVCPTIAYVDGLDDPKIAPDLKDYAGLNVVDYLVLPHFADPKYSDAYLDIVTQWKNQGYELIYITNEEAIIVEGEERKKVSI